jgi:alkylhydroperoxidase family enzyme
MFLLKIFLVLTLTLLAPLSAWAQRVMEARLKPVPASEWTDAHRQILGNRGARGDETAHVWTTCLRNLELCKNWMVFTDYVLSNRLSLTTRDRELIILRAGYLSRSDYEWAVHAGVGLRAGLTKEDLTRITQGPDAAGWSPADAMLLRAVDELHKDQHISDPTWASLRSRYDERQMMDIIFTTGQYMLVSMYLNSTGVQLGGNMTGIPR